MDLRELRHKSGRHVTAILARAMQIEHLPATGRGKKNQQRSRKTPEIQMHFSQGFHENSLPIFDQDMSTRRETIVKIV
jgi:hypothetical protein